MNPPRRREYLGGSRGYGSRVSVFAVPGALEIDEHDGYDIRRARVFFDDVLVVTRHKEFGWLYLIFTGLAAAFFGVMSILLLRGNAPATTGPGLIFFFAIACPFMFAFLVRLVLRLDVVTVFGKRTKAVIKFAIRKGKARSVFRSICEDVKAHQDDMAETLRASAPEVVTEELPAALSPSAGSLSAGTAEALPTAPPIAPPAAPPETEPQAPPSLDV